MDNEYKLLWKINEEIGGLIHFNMFNSSESGALFIYEICYLRLLSLSTFKQMLSPGRIVSLDDFINDYKKYIDNMVVYDCVHNSVLEFSMSDISRVLDLANRVLIDLERYKHSLKDINNIISIMCSYSDREISKIMTTDLYDMYGKNYKSTIQVCHLVNLLLDISKDDEVLNIYSNYGNFIVDIANNYDCKKVVGTEKNPELSLISEIRLMSSSFKHEIKCVDAFDLDIRDKYDKIFCNYPWGLRKDKYRLDYIIEKSRNMIFNWEKTSGGSEDWLYINLAVSLLKTDGKAVALMPSGPLYKTADEIYRKDIVESDYIESVIKLPCMQKSKNNNQYLLVLGKNNKQSVKFVDLSSQIEQSYHMRDSFNFETINEIISDNNNPLIRIVDKAVLKDNEYALLTDNYIGKKEIKLYNPTKLAEYKLDVFRGYQMKAKEQQDLESKDGEYEILLISDINDGSISDNLIRINPEKGKYDRYLIKNNDLIVSSKGTRIKIAVVENIKNRKIIASGNLIVLRLDTSRINPNYVEMYLNSSDGQTQLKQIQTGAVIFSINPSKLIELMISAISLDKQNQLANEYRNNKKELQLARERVFKLEQAQEHFYENNIDTIID